MYMYLLHVLTTCTYYMYLLRVLTTCTCYMYLLHVLTTCTYYMYQLHVLFFLPYFVPNHQIIKFILQIIDFNKYGYIMYSHRNFSYWIMLIIGLAGKEVWRFELSFICCTFKAKFLPFKLWCHTHFNFLHLHTCTCTIIINVRLIMCPCSSKVEAALLAALLAVFVSVQWC